MFQVVLYRPEIPPNTGNVIRMCANTGVALHLIHPLGFSMDDARLRRAGLDYREYADVTEHPDFDGYLEACQPNRLFALSGSGSRWHSERNFRRGDAFLFGPESVGLDDRVLAHRAVTDVLRIPMLPATPQPQPGEFGRDSPVRGLAATRLPWRGVRGRVTPCRFQRLQPAITLKATASASVLRWSSPRSRLSLGPWM